MIKEKINKDLKDSMLNANKTMTMTLRLVMAAIKDREIIQRSKKIDNPLDDSSIIEVLSKMVKQRVESAEIYKANGRVELAEKENEEIDIIRNYMPKQLSEEETVDAITQSIQATNSSDIKDMGKIMSELKSNYSGQIDFSLAGKLVKEMLTEQKI
jgi:hypothetical protein|tara:strand:+ start:3824 stop:4291 length:468 start_codon:yes stop_codon:yes gene_type:complete